MSELKSSVIRWHMQEPSKTVTLQWKKSWRFSSHSNILNIRLLQATPSRQQKEERSFKLQLVHMKELLKEIFISVGACGSEKSQPQSTKGSSSAKKKKAITLYPPIENHWELPHLKEKQRPNRSFVKMLSNPFRWSPSIKLVLEGPHDPKDEKIVESFREILLLDGQLPGKQFDYHTLLRFLRMRDFDLMKAKDMFMQYIKWREEFGVDDIVKEFKYAEDEEVKKCYPHGFHGVDRYGRPIYIERIGKIDMDKFVQVTSIDRFVKHHIYEQERTLNWRYPACSLASKKHIASTFSILDVKDVGTSQFSKPARYLFMEIQKIDSNYYPETLHQLYIVNAGSRFRVLWSAIKAFLDARTIAKIRVLGTDYKRSLIEVIDPSNLPVFLGGNCTCSELGGCLFSDKGPWNDPDITAILQGLLHTEDENERGMSNACNEKGSVCADKDQARLQQDLEEATLPPNSVKDATARKQVNEALFRKILGMEPVLKDAQEKIGMLEVAINDVKLVLRGVEQQIQGLKSGT